MATYSGTRTVTIVSLRIKTYPQKDKIICS